MQHIAITMPGRPILAPLLIECDMTREGIALAVEALIARLDDMDGDPDVEPAGDEQDGQFGEDEPCARFGRMKKGPGSLVSDGDTVNGDEADSCGGEDEAQIYFNGRGALTGPGCEISDEDGEPDVRAMRKHRDRIRATRCDIVGGSRWHPEYRLRA